MINHIFYTSISYHYTYSHISWSIKLFLIAVWYVQWFFTDGSLFPWYSHCICIISPLNPDLHCSMSAPQVAAAWFAGSLQCFLVAGMLTLLWSLVLVSIVALDNQIKPVGWNNKQNVCLEGITVHGEKNMIWLKKTYAKCGYENVWHGICMKDVALMICFPCVGWFLGSNDASSQLRRHSEELARIRHERLQRRLNKIKDHS